MLKSGSKFNKQTVLCDAKYAYKTNMFKKSFLYLCSVKNPAPPMCPQSNQAVIIHTTVHYSTLEQRLYLISFCVQGTNSMSCLSQAFININIKKR